MTRAITGYHECLNPRFVTGNKAMCLYMNFEKGHNSGAVGPGIKKKNVMHMYNL